MEKENYKYIIRIANTDLDGKKQILLALQKIKGVGHMYANMLCHNSGLPIDKIAGKLSDAEIKKLNETLKDISKVPTWMLNRRKDRQTGEDQHIITGDLQFTKENDLKRLKKIKCYRGIRHMFGLTCRGQKTKSNFRRNKNKGKGGLGVKRKR